jgi:hypothetical protein
MLVAAVVLLVVAGGTLATYLWDEDEMPLLARLVAGVALGLAVWGLVGFALALALGLKGITVAGATVVAAAPLALLASRARHDRVVADLAAVPAAIRQAPGQAAVLGAMAIALLVVFQGAIYERAGAIYTSDHHNLGDLPFHVGIVTGFQYGENIPPEHPELSGARLTYPFLVDFVAAMLMRAGASLRTAFFLENGLLALALLGLLYYWGRRLTGDRTAALLVPPLVLLNGGLGFWMFVRDAYHSEGGLLRELMHLTHDFTILSQGDVNSPIGSLRWGNSITTLFLTQRAFLMGLPLAILAWTLVWEVIRERPSGDARREARRMRHLIAAGVVTGLLPLVHTHSFAVIVAAAVCWMALFATRPGWLRFAEAVIVTAAPSLVWLLAGSGMAASAFLGWQVAWDRGGDNGFWFWLYNTGLVIPVLVAAFAWRGREPVVRRDLALLLLPFAGCFIVPNFLRLAPWIWDNIKFLFYWYVASTPVLALLVVRLWRRREPWTGLAAAILFLSMTLAGGLDVWRVTSRQFAQRIFDAPSIAFARTVRENTPPRAVILRLPTHNHAVLLTGRRSYLGYTGHIFSQGLDPGQRETTIQALYRGSPEAIEVARAAGVEYVVVGPMERSALTVREAALDSLPQVASAHDYRLLRIPER